MSSVLLLAAWILTTYRASFPDDKVHTMQSNEHINVENDSEVKTQ